MAINIFDKYGPTRATAPSGDYPAGSIKNESLPGANDGTPLDQDWGNDYAGFDAALFAAAGTTPSGDPDTANSSQRMEALIKIFGITVDTKSDLTSITVNVGDVLKTKGHDSIGDGGAAIYDVVTTASQSPDPYVNPDLGGGLTAKLRWGERGLVLSKIGIVDGSASAYNSAAIQEVIIQAEARGGATLYVPPHDNKFDDPIKLRETVSLVGIVGFDRGLAGLRYVGTTFQDFVTSETGHRNYIGLEDLIIFGGEFQQGRARYTVGFDGFNTRSHIKNCFIRDGLGLLRIDSGFYCTLENVQCGRPTPKQDSPAVPFTDAEWGQVYSGTNAPVKLVEMNACTINRLQIAQPTSEPTTGNTPVQAVYITGEDPVINGMTLESVGESYSGFNPTCEIGITSEVIGVFNGLYMEAVFTTVDFFRTVGYARTTVKGFSSYNMSADTFARCLSTGDLSFEDGQIWRADVRRLDFTQAAGDSDFGDGGDIVFERVSWRSGGTNTEQDTKDVTYKNGCIDGPFNDSQTSNRYVRFPRIVGGLGVNIGTDGDGAFCTVQNGTFIAQNGKKINCKAAVLSGSSIQPQTLRPDVASQYWRVVIGKAGNIHLEKSGTPFTDPRGDWIASFETDGGGTPSNLQANERLTLDGNYIGGTSQAVIKRGSNSAPTFIGRDGDSVENWLGTSGQPTGWVYNTGWVSKGVYP